MSELSRRLRALFRRARLDRELEEEMRYHLEMQAEEHRQNGMDPEDARYAAQRQFGNGTLVAEQSSEIWIWRWLQTLLQDVRYALRGLRNHPGFTAVAVLTVALGVGLTTGVFSLVDTLLYRPLPFPGTDRLVSLYYRTNQGVSSGMSYPDYEFFRDRTDFTSSLAAYSSATGEFRFGDQAEEIAGEMVSWNYFRTLGVEPAAGRAFLPEEDRVPGEKPVVILGHALWMRRFGGDPGLVGRPVSINGTAFTVIGIAPRGFRGFSLASDAPEFWAPTMMYPVLATWASGQKLNTYRGNTWLQLFGRLKSGMTMEQAQARMAEAASVLKREYWDPTWQGFVEMKAGLLYRLSETRMDPAARTRLASYLWLLFGVACLMLLISSLNVAALLLLRAVGRGREIALRLSLGAGRGRLVRQLLTESTLLSLIGGVGGLAVALAASRYLAGFHAIAGMSHLEQNLDTRMLAFGLLTAVLTGLLFGLAPARVASRMDLSAALKAEPRSGFRGIRLRQVLIAGQIAVSLVLLVGAGLFVRTLVNAQATDVTADPAKVLLFPQQINRGGFDEKRGRLVYPELVRRVRAVPGVRQAALVYVVPMGGRRGATQVVLSEGQRAISVDTNVVSADYFRTVGIPVVRGRDFAVDDREGAPEIAIVNERWAARFWPGQEPIGKTFQLAGRPPRTVQVVGVVRDGRFRNYRADLSPCFYRPFAQQYTSRMSLEVRTETAPLALLPAIRREIAAVDKDYAKLDAVTLQAYRDAGLGQERLMANLLSALGILALALAAIGVYGVVSFSAAQRTRDIGLRIAVGAAPMTIASAVLKQGLWQALAGAVAGSAAAMALTRLVAAQLFGVSPTDPLTYLAAAALLIAIALLASCIPALRASRIDPMEALRHE